jgi:hypothetical protein
MKILYIAKLGVSGIGSCSKGYSENTYSQKTVNINSCLAEELF